ncbi:hypothetical protein IJ670_04930 [bacterium]|nr:hypothetical protein [bacterium]
MLLDTQNLFSDNQAMTTGNIMSQNVVKFGKGNVCNLPIIIQVTDDFETLTSLTVTIQTSVDEEFTNPVDLATSTLALSALKKGALFPLSYLPEGNLGYMRIKYTCTGSSAETTGKITAGVVASKDIKI